MISCDGETHGSGRSTPIIEEALREEEAVREAASGGLGLRRPPVPDRVRKP
jgi:hypothetical protein